jgi:hypothetical protein
MVSEGPDAGEVLGHVEEGRCDRHGRAADTMWVPEAESAGVVPPDGQAIAKAGAGIGIDRHDVTIAT